MTPGLDLRAQDSHDDHCQGSCPVCIQTRRMVSAVIAGSINEIIAYLEDEDLNSAQKHAAAFLAVLDEVPASTSELVGKTNFSELKKTVEKGLWDISNGESHSAFIEFQSGLSAWYETYPPYRA